LRAIGGDSQYNTRVSGGRAKEGRAGKSRKNEKEIGARIQCPQISQLVGKSHAYLHGSPHGRFQCVVHGIVLDTGDLSACACALQSEKVDRDKKEQHTCEIIISLLVVDDGEQQQNRTLLNCMPIPPPDRLGWMQRVERSD
jgi:hypothetical protein